MMKAKSPFGENHVNSPSTPKSSTTADENENASVLSCPPSKQPSSNTPASFQDGSAKSRSLDSSGVLAVMANMFHTTNNEDDDGDSKENQQQQQPSILTRRCHSEIPSGITTNAAEEPNNVSIITVENPFDKYSSNEVAQEGACDEIEVVTVTNESLEEEEEAQDEKEQAKENEQEEEDEDPKNSFALILEEKKEEQDKAENASKDSPAEYDVAVEEKQGGTSGDGKADTEDEEAGEPKTVQVDTADDTTGSGTKDLTIESVDTTPRAHYLRAIQQTAAKCKTMVTTPKEIVSGHNPTPPSSVSAQMKRVLEGRDCQAESPDCAVQWIPASEERKQQPQQSAALQNHQEHRSAFDIALKTHADTPERHQTATAFTGGSEPTSAFYSFQAIAEQNVIMNAPSSSDELSVKEEVLDGTDSSYLQLDVESVASMHTFDIDEETKKPSAMDSLKSSLAMIWNNTAKSNKSSSSNTSKEQSKTHIKIPDDDDEEVATNVANSDSKTAPAAISTMESLRSSLSMIWNSKPSSKTVVDHGDSDAKNSGDVELANNSKSTNKSKMQHNGLSARNLTDVNRSRMLSEESLSRRANVPMGSQYLERGRSPARGKTVTPVPLDEAPEVDDIIECKGTQQSSSFDSMEDFWESIRNTPGKSKMVNASFYVSSPRSAKSNGMGNPAPSPKGITSTPTSETEDSFIKAAMDAENTSNVVVTYNSGQKPETKSWQPPEQEKEQEAMIRAILERPDLVEKSDKEVKQSKKWNCAKIRKYILITLAIFVAVITITGCLVCGITGKCTSRDDDNDGANIVDPNDEVLPLTLELPDYTKESLRSYHTAQAKAYLWLENDPNQLYYTDSRKVQRFALATLYFSTKIAQNWTKYTSWLDYDTHECFWFSHYDGLDVCEGDDYKRLVLPKNNLRGNLPPELALLTSLVEIDLSRNVLFGPIPEQLGSLTNLEKLWLEKNELNGHIPWPEIGDLANLRNISLATNDLKGPISSEVSRLTNLQGLRLFYNFLTGTLPTEIGLLTNLGIFDVDVNHLTGKVPSEIGQLTKLNELWLDWNSFVGPLPTTLGLLENVEKLYLGRMFVDSVLRDNGWVERGDYTIPSELGQLTNLRELYMDNNDLTGLIPVELSALTKLETATFDHNLLTDSISPGICGLFEGELESLSVDCAEVLCTCGCTCVAA